MQVTLKEFDDTFDSEYKAPLELSVLTGELQEWATEWMHTV